MFVILNVTYFEEKVFRYVYCILGKMLMTLFMNILHIFFHFEHSLSVFRVWLLNMAWWG
jgi:hypothetical protein